MRQEIEVEYRIAQTDEMQLLEAIFQAAEQLYGNQKGNTSSEVA